MIETWRRYWAALSARQRALIGAALLLAVSGAALLWEDEPETVVTLREETAPPPTTEIAGLSAAAQKMPLHNPFTDAHETAAEAAQTGETVTGEAEAEQPHTRNLPAASVLAPPVSASAPPVPTAPFVLRGVVTDANGVRIAIIAKGAESAALAVGETWQGHTLRTLTDRSAVLDSESGSITVTRE